MYTSCSSDRNQRNRTPVTQEQRIQETKTLEHFLQVIRNRLENSQFLQKVLAGETSDVAYNELDFKAERESLLQINNLGLKEGIATGLVTFVALRMAPRVVARMIARRQFNQNLSQPKAYVFDTAPQRQLLEGFSFALATLKIVRLMLDASASLLIAAYTSFLYADERVMLKTVRELPLVEGRSIVSDEFCGTLQDEYRNVHPPEFWDKVNSPYLQTLSIFVLNCRLRQAQEAKLRQESGLSETEPVSIPSPGVFTAASVMDDSFGNPSLFGIDSDVLRDEDDAAWAKALVTAKGEEDDDRNNN